MSHFTDVTGLRSRVFPVRATSIALCVVALAAAFGFNFSAVALELFSKPVTMVMVVPYAAGGPTDALARIIAEPLGSALGRTIVIENITGAAGSIATARTHDATPDGTRVIIGNWGTHVINGAVKNLSYDLLSDFEPIGLIANNPHVIVSRPGVPARDLKELIAWVKENQSKLTAANSGVGSPTHISGLQFQRMTGTEFPFVAYRGSGPAVQDLMAGQIDLYFDQVSNSMAAIKSGMIKAYAIASKTRSAAVPDIPTVDEAGLPGFYSSVWHGLWAPKGTSREIVSKLNAALVKALADPGVRQRLAEIGQEIVPVDQQTPAGLAAYQKAEIEKWWPIIKGANITIQ
jgi:tripartite-type tricarboxylate transporter receptor subunit TctC